MFSRTVPRNTHVSCSTMENWSCTFQRGTDLVSTPSIAIEPPEIS